MAKYSGAGITISFEKRPCFVDGKKAIFHCWTFDRETLDKYTRNGVYAIVEFEDGSVKTVNPFDIIFADGGDFKEFAFIDKKIS